LASRRVAEKLLGVVGVVQAHQEMWMAHHQRLWPPQHHTVPESLPDSGLDWSQFA
jgi:hypothetical protein